MLDMFIVVTVYKSSPNELFNNLAPNNIMRRYILTNTIFVILKVFEKLDWRMKYNSVG